MKKTFREKIKFWSTREKKKHKYLSPFISAVAAMCLGGNSLCLSLLRNGKKIVCAGVVLMYFFVSSSFGYQGQAKASDVPLDENGLQFEVEDATQKDVDLAEQINEEDILEVYDDLALLEFEDPDLYTLEDILAENEAYIESKENESRDEDFRENDSTEGDIFREEDNSREENSGEDEEQSGERGETDRDVSSGDGENLQFDPEDWRLLLVNKQHPIPDDYEVPLGTIKGSLKCDERVLEDLFALMQAAKDDGIDLNIASPYRDYNQQKYLFKKKMDKYLDRGLSYMDAYRVASTIVTAPNASEHQLGLAFDFNCDSHTSLNAAFAKTETGKWLKENCAEYGFILRYPEGKEYITGIIYEPWHFRYVGKEAAQFITEQEITLEEFWEDYLN